MPAEQPAKSGQPFDVETVRKLAELMSKYDLNEICYNHGGTRIRLRRGMAPIAVATPAPVAATSAPAATAPVSGAPVASGKKRVEIKSEAIGTFYSRPKPDAKPFVEMGSKITPTTIVCLIEAMKLFNEIPAGCAGTIAEVCVENQQAVEYGTVLFRVDPA